MSVRDLSIAYISTAQQHFDASQKSMLLKQVRAEEKVRIAPTGTSKECSPLYQIWIFLGFYLQRQTEEIPAGINLPPIPPHTGPDSQTNIAPTVSPPLRHCQAVRGLVFIGFMPTYPLVLSFHRVHIVFPIMTTARRLIPCHAALRKSLATKVSLCKGCCPTLVLWSSHVCTRICLQTTSVACNAFS